MVDFAIYMKKYLKAKDELWELKYFTMQKCNLQKSSKRNQNPSRYYKSNRVTIIIRVINLSYKSDRVFDFTLGSRTFGSSFNTSQNIHLSKLLP